MTNSDIKLVIDQLEQMDFGSIEDKHVVGNAINALETLGNQVAEQAVEIIKLREYFQEIREYNLYYGIPRAICDLYTEALALPTNSTQILEEYFNKRFDKVMKSAYPGVNK